MVLLPMSYLFTVGRGRFSDLETIQLEIIRLGTCFQGASNSGIISLCEYIDNGTKEAAQTF
jgi:hypothetical protein